MIVFGVEGRAFISATPDCMIDEAGRWIELTIVRNVSVARQMKEVDVTTRGNAAYEATDVRLTNAAIQLELPLDPADAGYRVLETAYTNNAPVTLAVLSGGVDTLDARGPVGTYKITGFERDENLDGAMMIKASAKPLRGVYEYVNAPLGLTVDSNSTSRVIALNWTYNGTPNISGFHVRYTTGAIIAGGNGQPSWTSLADQADDAETAEYTMNPAPSLMPTRVQIQAYSVTAAGAWIEGVINSHA